MVRPRSERRVLHATLLVVTLLRVVARQHLDDGAIAVLVFSGLAFLSLGPGARVPCAIVVRGGGRRHWRSMLPRRLVPPIHDPEPDHADVGQWRPLEPYVLDSRPWT